MEGKIFCLRGYDKLHARLWRDTRMLVYSRSLWRTTTCLISPLSLSLARTKHNLTEYQLIS